MDVAARGLYTLGMPAFEISTEAPVITITPRAVEMGKRQLQEAAGKAEEEILGLRLGVKGGGCSGYYYVFEPATKQGKRDLVWDYDGLVVFVDNRSLKFLEGATLDWEQKLLGYGFKWENPLAKGDCGCGMSFNA